MHVFYHLGELDDALNYALGAGSRFNVAEDSEYVQTLIGKYSVRTSRGTRRVFFRSNSAISRDYPAFSADITPHLIVVRSLFINGAMIESMEGAQYHHHHHCY